MTGALEADPAADALRARIERALGSGYRVVRLLGRGGMGAVFLAREEALDRLVAVKVLPDGGDSESRDRFRREARLAAQLNHPNIVPLLGFGEAAGTMFLILGYVQGESLGARLRREGRLSADDVRRVVAEIAEALDYAHRRGVIHRDLKPDNILLDDESGRALLADFGIARGTARGDTLTRAGDVVGTPQYMSPEQARGADVDGRSDLYSLGAVAFAALTGRPPFEGAFTPETLLKRLTQDAPSLRSVIPEAQAELAGVVDRCLARDPAARFPDARALRLAVAPTALDEEQLAEPLDVLDGLGATLTLLLAIAVALTASYATQAYELLGSFLRQSASQSKALVVLDWFFHEPTLIPLAGWALFAFQAQLPLAAARESRARGFSWSDIRFAFLRQPRGWPIFWYPKRFRRRDDVWTRLPPPFRRARACASMAAVLLFFFTLMAAALEFVVAARLRAPAILVILGQAGILALGISLLGLIGNLWAGFRFLRRSGFDRFRLHRASRALVFRPTADRSVWRQPDLAGLLSPPGAERAVQSPEQPSDFEPALARMAARLDGESRELATQAASAAHRLADQIARIDTDLPHFARDADVQEAQRIDERLPGMVVDSDDRRTLRDLLVQQREILRRAALRLAEARETRARCLDTLNALWSAVQQLSTDSRTASSRLRGLLREARSEETAPLSEAPTREFTAPPS